MAASEVMTESTSSSTGRKPKKAIIESDSEEEGISSSSCYNMDTDISQLEAPTFTTLDRGPSRSVVQLKWDHEVNLIGKKVVNPMIHCCDKCLKPILIYGRTIPCKHVFCLKCARAEKNGCSRCGEKFSRVEQAGLGSIYMCSHGGSRYGNDGCRRTYLSQRDLHAHIQHRHLKTASNGAAPRTSLPATASAKAPQQQQQQQQQEERTFRLKEDFQHHSNRSYSPRTSYNYSGSQQISVINSNRNLITVPIEGGSNGDQNGDYAYSAPANSAGYNGQYPADYSHPPPNFNLMAEGYYNYEGGYGSSNGAYRTTLAPPASSASSTSSSSNNYYRR